MINAIMESSSPMCFQLQPASIRVAFQSHREHNYPQLLVNDCIMIFLQDICSDDGDDGERRGSFMVSRRTLLIAFTQRDCFRASSFRRGLSKDVDTMNAWLNFFF